VEAKLPGCTKKVKTPSSLERYIPEDGHKTSKNGDTLKYGIIIRDGESLA
jgi:hypothetical protein